MTLKYFILVTILFQHEYGNLIRETKLERTGKLAPKWFAGETAKYFFDFGDEICVVEFENYLKKNELNHYYVKEIELKAAATKEVYTLKVETPNINPKEDNEITYALGTAELTVMFKDNFELKESFHFVDGPMGNGATPNGSWLAGQHKIYRLNANPSFVMTYNDPPIYTKRIFPTPYLYEEKVQKSKTHGVYPNRGSMLIHGVAEIANGTTSYDANGKEFRLKETTAGCIGIVGIDNSIRYLPFFASYIYYNGKFKVEINFEGNKNIGYQLYKKG